MNKKENERAYGMTNAELAQLGVDQGLGNIEMVPANQNPDYSLPIHEAKFIYLVMYEAELFDQFSGVKLSRPRIGKFNIPTWDKMNKEKYFQSMKVEVLHDPRKEGNKVGRPSKKSEGVKVTKSVSHGG